MVLDACCFDMVLDACCFHMVLDAAIVVNVTIFYIVGFAGITDIDCCTDSNCSPPYYRWGSDGTSSGFVVSTLINGDGLTLGSLCSV